MNNCEPYLTDAYQRKVLEEWTKFVHGIHIKQPTVRKSIYESWVRCKKNDIDPLKINNKFISEERFKIILDNEKNLLEAALPIFEHIFSLLNGDKIAMSLANKDGIILTGYSSTEIMKENLYIHGQSVEPLRGNSAISTCLYTKEPYVVLGNEFWLEKFHRFGSAAAPIFDERHAVIGAISVRTVLENFHQYSYALAIATASLISHQYQILSLLKEQSTLLEQLGDGVLSLSHDGIISAVNSKALRMLGLNMSPVGLKIDKILTAGPLLRMIVRGQAFNNQEMTLALIGKETQMQYILSYTPFSPNTKGVLTLKEISPMREYAIRMSGANASYTFEDILGNSGQVREVIKQAQHAAASDLTILILGESGTGKEMFAQSIHNASDRRDGPFIVLNCGALPRDLVQAELFGYVGGAFTGANRQGNPGKFELAHGGSIFLDEIGEMSLDAQVALLRLLQNKEVVRLGDKRSRHVDVRVIAATNRNLEEAVAQKKFREDLYYRLNGVTLRIPPLRARQMDIEVLSRNFLAKFGQRRTSSCQRTLSSEVREALLGYAWPGNIRELEHAVESAMYMATGNIIEVTDLPIAIQQAWRNQQESNDEKQAEVDADVSPEGTKTDLNGAICLAEKDAIIQALKRGRGKVRYAAELLGMARSTLYKKMTAYGLEARRFRYAPELAIKKADSAQNNKNGLSLTPVQIRNLVDLLTSS